MEVILISRRSGSLGPLRLGRWALALTLVLVVSAIGAGGYFGFRIGERSVVKTPAYTKTLVKQELDVQNGRIESAIDNARDSVDALSVRLGEMQARMIRLEALGSRLVEMGSLDAGEFNFADPPAVGGRFDSSVLETQSIPDFVESLELLAGKIEARAPMLEALEVLLMNEQLESQVHPAGRPVLSGWMSSGYGYRSDPLTGKKAFHDGVDFAGRSGSDIVAVAAGVVTESRYRHGMGNLVQIYHGNGYSTRYAHNKQNLVKVGDAVRKGQTIAYMGNSGRSTGPHVHFEVLIGGMSVNPIDYIRAEK